MRWVTLQSFMLLMLHTLGRNRGLKRGQQGRATSGSCASLQSCCYHTADPWLCRIPKRCTKLWAAIEPQADLHPFPVSGLLKPVKAATAADPQAVQTPKEVYQALKAEGYRVDYHRVPLTDGVAPGEAAFDMFFEHLKDARAEDPLVFNCQMGSGRTTTGMVIGCLIRMHTTGQSAG